MGTGAALFPVGGGSARRSLSQSSPVGAGSYGIKGPQLRSVEAAPPPIVTSGRSASRVGQSRNALPRHPIDRSEDRTRSDD
jgi:hypothetical protein